jgi:ATP-binding cassette subfamily D (ALD) long-chain fatty acid import protein
MLSLCRIIYPHTLEDMAKAGRSDDELMDILKVVHLDYIPSREGGWETQKEWKDVFSGGEKQRVRKKRKKGYSNRSSFF